MTLTSVVVDWWRRGDVCDDDASDFVRGSVVVRRCGGGVFGFRGSVDSGAMGIPFG